MNQAKSKIQVHRAQANVEFKIYKQYQAECSNTTNIYHVAFDYAEKVLILRKVEHPGQLHFLTGLKFNLNGVLCSKTGRNYIFGLPEGH